MKENEINFVGFSMKNNDISNDNINTNLHNNFDENLELNLTSENLSFQKIIDDLDYKKNHTEKKMLNKSFFNLPKEKAKLHKKDYYYTRNLFTKEMETKIGKIYRNYTHNETILSTKDIFLKKKHIKNDEKNEIQNIITTKTNMNSIKKNFFKIDSFNFNIQKQYSIDDKSEVLQRIDNDYFQEKMNLNIQTFNTRINNSMKLIKIVIEASENIYNGSLKITITKISNLTILCRKNYKNENYVYYCLKIIKNMFKIMYVLEEMKEFSFSKELLDNLKVKFKLILEISLLEY